MKKEFKMNLRIYKTKSRALKYFNYCKDFQKLNPVEMHYDKEFKLWVVVRAR